MAIHTSANFYRRGIKNSYTGFAKVAQANYSIVQPTNKFIRYNNFFNRNINTVMYGHRPYNV